MSRAAAATNGPTDARRRRRLLAAGSVAILAAATLSTSVPGAVTAGAAAARVDTRFTIAVIPDTQRETKRPGDPRFRNRTTWLVDHRRGLDLRFVVHSGDLVDWDTPDHAQYRVAADAMGVLQDAGIPYAIPPGNHDTAAVCPGGGACDTSLTRELLRDTRTFNAFLPASGFGAVRRQFEPGKVDNAFSAFWAGGVRWGVLNLELWPRVAVVRWARRIVAEHPRHNIVIATHGYLTSGGAIGSSAEYGHTSPRYLFDHLVKRYANVRFVLSGHKGTSATRQDVGVHRNRILSFQQCFHDERTNPVRLLEIDTRRGTVKSRIYAPYTNTRYPRYDRTVRGVTWVR